MPPQETPDTWRSFIGAVISDDGKSVGTCFQIREGVLVTAYHVFSNARLNDESNSAMFRPINGGNKAVAHLYSFDEEHDLAVLQTETPLPNNSSHLFLSEKVIPETKFQLLGVAELTESYGTQNYSYLPATGTWQGVSRKEQGPISARGHAPNTEQGMSGCPALREEDGAVIGILSQRYSSTDWSSGTVWMSCIEQLLPLITDFDGIPIETPSPIPGDKSSWLAETPINRKQIIYDELFFYPEEWDEAWNVAEESIKRGDLIVIVSPPGFGATTFAEQLLARTTPERMQINRIDPEDWANPTSHHIPQKPHKAYLLDLRDPEYDRPTKKFIEDLSRLATWHKRMQSRIVVTVHDHLWYGLSSRISNNLRVIRLKSPPEPLKLAKHHLEKREPSLLSVLEEDDVAKSFQGMNSLKAQDAVETIIEAKRDLLNERTWDPGQIKEKIIELLADHSKDLDELFGIESNDETANKALSLEDRCLLLALSFRKKAHISQIEADSERLFAELDSGDNGAKGRIKSRSAADMLAGPGLRGRLSAINAYLGPSEMVEISQPNFGEATLRYVWENYAAVREKITAWMLGCAEKDEIATELAAERLSKLLRQNQDVAFIKNELASYVNSDSEKEILGKVLYDSARDQHMQRQCERILYEWSHKISTQPVVVDVCEKLVNTERRDIALTRLRRVADFTQTPPDVRELVMNIFLAIAQSEDPNLVLWFSNATRSWFVKDQKSPAARFAFIALTKINVDNVPWILSLDANKANPHEMLIDLVVHQSAEEFSQEVLSPWITQISHDDQLYERTIDMLHHIDVAQGTMLQFSRITHYLQEIGQAVGRDPVNDLEIRRARLRSSNNSDV